jgi:uncharacterized protein YoxC
MVWALVAIGAVTAVVVLVLVVVLLRHLHGLATSLKALQEELVPVLNDIQRGSEEAQRTLARVQERAASARGESG